MVKSKLVTSYDNCWISGFETKRRGKVYEMNLVINMVPQINNISRMASKACQPLCKATVPEELAETWIKYGSISGKRLMGFCFAESSLHRPPSSTFWTQAEFLVIRGSSQTLFQASGSKFIDCLLWRSNYCWLANASLLQFNQHVPTNKRLFAFTNKSV